MCGFKLSYKLLQLKVSFTRSWTSTARKTFSGLREKLRDHDDSTSLCHSKILTAKKRWIPFVFRSSARILLFNSATWRFSMAVGSKEKLRSLNHDDASNDLHIWQWKTVFLHALHVHFSSFDILKTFSFFLRREMTCFAVVWKTWAYDDKCSILSSYVPSAGSNLIPG